jgi:hypothetical protein
VRSLPGLALLGWLANSAAVLAAEEPPVWANLAECSAVFSAAARSTGYAGTEPEEIAQADEAAAAFLEQAVTSAGAAGQANPEADVASIMAYLTPRWESRIDKLFSVPSNMRWIAYCGQLGRKEGVLPLAASN